ncbi:hypothetical protein U1Q18_019914 [Sarracenia purpurea var. burkii]
MRRLTYRSSVCGNGSNNKEEIESYEEFEEESLGNADGRNSDATRHVGVENPFESKRSADGCRNLGCYVSWDLGPGEVTKRCKGNGE